MSFIFWSDVTFIYIMYYIIIYVICQIGNYLVDTYLFPRFYVRHSVCTEYCLYYKCGVLIYQLGAPYCTIPCNILPTWNKRAQLYKPDSLCLLCIFRTFVNALVTYFLRTSMKSIASSVKHLWPRPQPYGIHISRCDLTLISSGRA